MGKVHVGDLLCIGHKLWYQIGCGPGMPGPYRVAGRFTARIVGGGVLDAPQGSSLSRVTYRAASPLAAVAVCDSGKVPSKDCRSPSRISTNILQRSCYYDCTAQ